MDDLLIYGGGGVAREILAFVQALNEVSRRWRCLGFFVEPGFEASETVHDLPVFRHLDALPDRAALNVCIGIGDPAARQRIAGDLAAAGVTRFPVLIHPRAWVGPRVAVGAGSVICGGAMVTTDIALGAHVQVHVCATIGHDSVIGDCVTVSPGAHISGHVRLGARVNVGAGATVIPSVAVGADCVIGAGAVVIRDLPAGTTAVGVPARIIRMRR
ncbi:MAG: acetyltransferase [Acetobacteraceae bacterium]